MRARSVLLVSVASALFLIGCQSREAAIRNYFAATEPIAEMLIAAGTRFEALMTVEGEIGAWTPEQKKELDGILGTMEELRDAIRDMDVPADLAEAHPILVDSVTQTTEAVRMVTDVVEHPEAASEEIALEIVAKAEAGERLADDYAAKVEEILRAKYPQMLEGEARAS